MRIPRRGEKGFTLIELLIVVAILGVLAAVVIPNVGRFIGAGEEEAKDTELSNMQAAVHAMMVDNELATLPAGTFVTSGSETNLMSAFPSTATIASGAKDKDVFGVDFVSGTDEDGYILYQHDRIGGGTSGNLTNYVATSTTAYWYWVDASGTVSQSDTAPTP